MLQLDVPFREEGAMHLRALVCLLGLTLACAARAGDADLEQAVDEKTLRDAGVPTDSDGLLAFLKKRSLTDADHDRLRDAVRLLGDDEFQVRQKATDDLIAAGRSVLPFLRPA